MVRGKFSRIKQYLELVVGQFLDYFFPQSRMLQKDKIYSFSQLHCESMYEALFWFKKKLIMVPNQRIFRQSLLEKFYRALNTSSKDMANTIIAGAFMHL